MKNILRTIMLIAIPIVLLAASEPIIMEHPTNWEHPDQATVKDSDLAFNFNRPSKHFKNDGIFFMTRFNGGWVFMSSYIGWQYGPIKKWGIYALVSDPNGKRYWAQNEIIEKDIVTAKDHLYMKGGKNVAEGRGMTYKVHYDFEGFYCDLTYKNVLPPWIPGDGWIYLSPGIDKDAYNHYMMNSPWADVTGTLTVGGKTHNVVGQGYSDRSDSALPPTKQNPYLYSIRVFSADGTPRQDRWFFGLLESISHADYGSKRIPMLLLAHGEKWVLTTKKYSLTPKNMLKGPNTPYEYPTVFQIKANDQGYVFDAEYKCGKLFDFTDIFAVLPDWVRSIATKFLKRPVFFRCLGELKGTLKSPDGTTTPIHLYGPHEYMVVK